MAKLSGVGPELNAWHCRTLQPPVAPPSLRTAFPLSCCVIILLARSSSFAIQWPDDAARTQTLRLLPADATNQLISMAARKSAWFFYGMEVSTHQAQSNKIALAINGQRDSYLGAALAVAIDPRGYFLTAAHVLATPTPFTLVFHDGSTLRSAPARIVARIPERSKSTGTLDITHTLDLALLHVSHVRLAKVFAWAEINPKPKLNPSPESVVIQLGEAKGRFSDTNNFIQFSPVAGHFKKLITLPSGGAVVQSAVPGRPGDSGGPLLNSNGELLAITAGLDVRLWGASLATATRPDLAWLRDTIETDQRSLPAPETNVTPVNVDEPAYVTLRFPE